MKSEKQQYFVHYVEECSPCLRKFKTRAELDDFLNKFLQGGEGDDDNYVDFVLYGFVGYASPYYEKSLRRRKR